ncbi:ankyrin repeat domain-containing protein [Pelagibacterium xiamenense]|uniref:ankyrin repeat domain-containing protein n=1 Tax=Pelagibacterium xiamenense TaxID=2901140 RepID=UPI001E4D3E26|nr:ankyrin repeat domain-containing protein [Pelagibacterium xiamenense]MCD7060214.1 ankyrin repeat domain-containing protein [Pelagibacterium xiamenense]
MGPARTVAVGVAMMALWACQPRHAEELETVDAVRDDDAAAVQRYLDAGGDPDAVNRDGHPLIYLATGPRGGVEVLSVLIAGGADLERQSDNGRTALMNAAGWCDAPMVRMLIAAGADVRHATPEGDTVRDAVCAGPLDRRAEVLNLIDAML